MSEFKVGDKIRVKKGQGIGEVLEDGTEHTVVSTNYLNDPLMLEIDHGGAMNGWYADRFEKVEDVVSFKVGDRVQLTEEGYGGIPGGAIGTVIVKDDLFWNDEQPFLVDFGEHGKGHPHLHLLKLVDPETESVPSDDDGWWTADLELGTLGYEDYKRLGLEVRLQVRRITNV